MQMQRQQLTNIHAFNLEGTYADTQNQPHAQRHNHACAHVRTQEHLLYHTHNRHAMQTLQKQIRMRSLTRPHTHTQHDIPRRRRCQNKLSRSFIWCIDLTHRSSMTDLHRGPRQGSFKSSEKEGRQLESKKKKKKCGCKASPMRVTRRGGRGRRRRPLIIPAISSPRMSRGVAGTCRYSARKDV